MDFGIQLYSIRSVSEKSLEEAIKVASEIGYKKIEYAGFFGNSAEQVLEWQKKYNIACFGSHTGWSELTEEKIYDTIKYHKIIGGKNIIVPGADLSTLDKIESFCKIMNRANEIMKSEGMTLGYHNHSREFELMPWGSTIHSELEKRGTFNFEIDTYWAYNAGADPVQILDRLSDRINVIHLKDGLMGGFGRSLGEGSAPVYEVYKKAVEMGIDIVVESEDENPTGPAEITRCMNYLKNL